MSFTLVFVGAGNVGRTVLAEALLTRELYRYLPGSADRVVVRTAGVDALDGMPPSPHLVAVAARRGLTVQEHRATAMTREIAESADLLLTMTRRQRAQLVLQHPALRARTFSLVEFAVLLHCAAGLPYRPTRGPGQAIDATLRALVPVVAAQARFVPPPAEDGGWDLPDPYAQDLDVHERVAAQVEDVVHAVVADTGRLLRSAAATAVRSA
jgi:protein-tyrosine phosphatase